VQIHELFKFLSKNAAAAALLPPRRHYKNLSRAATVFEKICRCRAAMDISSSYTVSFLLCQLI
jgi:hypothetical protein